MPASRSHAEAAKKRKRKAEIAAAALRPTWSVIDVLFTTVVPVIYALSISYSSFRFLWRRLSTTKKGKEALKSWRMEMFLALLLPALYPMLASAGMIKHWFSTLRHDRAYEAELIAHKEEEKTKELMERKSNAVGAATRPLRRLMRADTIRRAQEPAKARRRGGFISKDTRLDTTQPQRGDGPRGGGGAAGTMRRMSDLDLGDKDEDIELNIRKAFEMFDEDGSGSIDTEELKKVFTTLGVKLTAKEADDMVKFADVDGDGMIDFEEFEQLLIGGNFHQASYWQVVKSNMSVMADVVVLTMAEDTLKASFEEIDTSGNGELDWSELKAWLELINAGSITDDDAKLMIEEADTDHNGECDFNEFKYCMSGKELDREQFAANSPWHKVREKLLNGKFFYIGTAGKPHLQDPPQVVVIKRRCRLGDITEERCETMLTEYYGNMGAAAASRQKQLTARGYNLKDSVANAAQAKRDLEEEKEEMKRLGITPNTPRGRAYLENTAERRGGAAFGGGSDGDESSSTQNIYALSRKEIQPLNEATGQFHSDDMLHMLDLFNAQMHFKTEH